MQQIGLNAPLGSPAERACWIMGTGPTSAWTAQANRLAQRIGGAWVFYAPLIGPVVFDAAILAQRGRNGSVWTLVVPRLLHASIPYDPRSLAAGGGVTTTVSVPGTALGDFTRARSVHTRVGSQMSIVVTAPDISYKALSACDIRAFRLDAISMPVQGRRAAPPEGRNSVRDGSASVEDRLVTGTICTVQLLRNA